VTSIGHAAKELRGRQRNWASYAPEHRGRAQLIADELPHVAARPLELGEVAPDAPLGSWTLLERAVVLAATTCTSPFPNGVPRFVEDRDGPPSRAYLKLWETFARLRRQAGPGERCLDLGLAPVGWTWLLARTGAEVTAVDRAPLTPEVDRLPEHDLAACVRLRARPGRRRPGRLVVPPVAEQARTDLRRPRRRLTVALPETPDP
jgi:23S rRNA (cytidine2498-2'-O)-methyltransferase